MATFIPSPWIKVLQRFQHASGGDVLSVTYGIQFTGSSRAAAVTEADTDFRAAWGSRLDTQVSFLPAWGYGYVASDPELNQFISTLPNAAGTASISSFPPNVALSLRKRTAFVGRKYRGRLFLPYMCDETGADEIGVVLAGLKTTINTQAASWLSNADGGSNYTGLWLLHEETGATEIVPTRITSLDVGPVVVTQRRRLPTV